MSRRGGFARAGRVDREGSGIYCFVPFPMHASNLFQSIPEVLPDELIEVLAEGNGHLRIVRLVSRGHASADGFWYDQEEHEWVVLLSGSGVLSFEDAATGDVSVVTMKPGDWLHIPPHVRHRVEGTDPGTDTVWLAVHWGEETDRGEEADSGKEVGPGEASDQGEA